MPIIDASGFDHHVTHVSAWWYLPTCQFDVKHGVEAEVD